MDRRLFVKGLFGLGVAAAGVAAISSEAEAAPMQVPTTAIGQDEAARLEADYRPETDGEAKTDTVQYYYYRRRRRRRIYRRVYRRRRRVWRRRRYYRRVYW